MSGFKSPRSMTVFLLALCTLLVGAAAYLSAGDFRAMLGYMGSQVYLNLILLALGLFVAGWGTWGLMRPAREAPTSLRWWHVARAGAGVLFATLAVSGFIENPRQLARLFLPRSDSTDEERLAKLTEGDLKTTPVSTSTQWPQWLGPNRDGRSVETGLNTDWKAKRPAELWRKPLGGGYSSLVHVNGAIYTMDRQGENERVVCLRADTGAEAWSHSYPADYSGMRSGYTEGPRATPSVHDGRVYTVGATGVFVCLELPGKTPQPRVLWQHDLLTKFNAPLPQWGVACSPLIEGDLVIVQPGGADGSVAAFDRVTGELRWKALRDKPGYSSPVATTLGGVRQIVCFTGEAVAGIRASDGKELWSQPWTTEYDCNAATPVIVGKCVFISSGYNTGCALYEIQGTGENFTAVPLHVRVRKLMRNHHSNCVLHEGHLYGFDDNNGILRCVNVKEFKETWSSRNPGKGCLIYAEGHLIILTQDGTLALVEATPKGYVSKGQFEIFSGTPNTWAFPALSQGRLYVRSNQEIVCLDLRK